MTVFIDDVARILGLTSDEVMLLVQTNKIQARVQHDPLAWVFNLEEVLIYKKLSEEADNYKGI